MTAKKKLTQNSTTKKSGDYEKNIRKSNLI